MIVIARHTPTPTLSIQSLHAERFLSADIVGCRVSIFGIRA